MEEKTNTIAVFDFDGTIIAGDSFPDFLIRTFGKRAFSVQLPFILFMKLAAVMGIWSAHRAKEAVLSSFVKGMREEEFQKACRMYACVIPQMVYPAALSEIRKHQEAGHPVVIISASIADWIKPWAAGIGISQVAATEVEIKKGILTGRFSTPNCKGAEKVNRLRSLFPDLNKYTLYAYGDSSGDKELLALADYPHYKHFSKN